MTGPSQTMSATSNDGAAAGGTAVPTTARREGDRE